MGRKGWGVAGSQPMSTPVHITWHGAQINFGDLPHYLTNSWRFPRSCYFSQGWEACSAVSAPSPVLPGTENLPILTSFWHLFKDSVRPDWICMRVVPLDRPWKRHQPLQVFYFFISGFEYLKRLQSSGLFIQKGIQTPACSDQIPFQKFKTKGKE